MSSSTETGRTSGGSGGGCGNGKGGGDLCNDNGSKIGLSNITTNTPHETTRLIASESAKIPLSTIPKNNQVNSTVHNSQQQQQQQLMLNRHECGSNQSGSDSGLGYTNSISSENSSLIANTTSLEQINAQNNYKGADFGDGEFVINHESTRQIPISERDSFNIGVQTSARSHDDSVISSIETASKSDAASAPSTIIIPNRMARTNDLNSDGHKIDAQHSRVNETLQQQPQSQQAKSVKVFESTSNNVRTKNDNDLMMSSMPLTMRTKNEPGDQEALPDSYGRESLTNNKTRVINTDNEAKIKHSTKNGANQLAVSTIRPDCESAIDKSGEILTNHEIQDSRALVSSANYQQLPQKNNPIVSPTSSTLPMIKSSLKKTGTRLSVDALKKTKHNRSVSFNQTVIVFCEEIETSSPSDTYEPPLDYQDSPPNDEHSHGLQSNFQVDVPIPRNSKAQSTYVDDGFDILSKIVCDDASSLTDDQLIGLLEDGSLFKKFDLDEDDRAIALDRLNSDQSYLCHDAISDSGSESSAAIDASYREAPAKINKSQHSSTRAKESVFNGNDTNRSTSCQSTKVDNSIDCNSSSQPVDCLFESKVGPIFLDQQRLMPAQVKVSTFDSNLRRHLKSTITAQTDETIDSSSQSRNACTKVVQSNKQNQIKSEPMPIRFTSAAEPTTLFKNRDSVSESTAKRQPALDSGKDCSQNVVNRANAVSTTNSLILTGDQISSRDVRTNVVDQHEQHFRDSTSLQQHLAASHTPTSQPINIVNAQVIQTNQACHICRAIESNLDQTKICPRVERTSLMTNNDTSQCPDRQVEQSQLQRTAQHHHQTQYHGTGNAVIESQQQNQSQLISSSQPLSSCVSCCELTARQQKNYVTQLVRSSLASNPIDYQQQTRPITCKLVYVVDQYGNRMKALQVVNPAQVGLNDNQSRPTIVAYDNCRPPALPIGQNLCRFPNPVSQLGVSRNGPVSTSVSHVQTTNNNHVAPTSVRETSSSQQQRMQLPNHSAPRSHTVYCVRQPLGTQNLRQSSNLITNSVVRSFPDVHEIRRLDGIRAPTEGPNLVQTISHSTASTAQPGNKIDAQPQSKTQNKSSKLRRDESEDPSFGFSRRPAVKVIAHTVRESQIQPVGQTNDFSHKTSGSSNNIRTLTGSHTLDRKNVNRDNPSQRDVKENIPSTSSMSNINKTLANFVGSTKQALYDDSTKSKASEINVGHIIDRTNLAMSTGHQMDSFVHARQDRKDQNGPDVAYVMNV